MGLAERERERERVVSECYDVWPCFGNPSSCSSAIIVEAGKVWPKQHITKDCRRGMSTFDEVWTKTRIITTLIAEFSFIDCPVIWA